MKLTINRGLLSLRESRMLGKSLKIKEFIRRILWKLKLSLYRWAISPRSMFSIFPS